MKKIFSLAMCLVLTGVLLVGCGCTNTGKNETSTPTGATQPTSLPTTIPTTAPATQSTQPSMEETTDTGNGALEDASTGPIESTREAEGRARGVTPRSGSSGIGGNSGMTGNGSMAGNGGAMG